MSSNNNSLREFEGFAIDGEKKVLWYKKEPVELPIKAIELLNVLVEANGEIVTKEELLDKVWQDSFVEEGVLSHNVYLLRKLFKEKKLNTELIQTVPRRGYRFTGELIETFEEEISIETETIEKTLIAETYVSDDEFDELKPVQDIQPKQLPSHKTGFTVSKNSLAFLILAFLFVAVIGTTAWFWKTPNSDSQSSKNKLRFSPELIKFSRLTDSGNAFYPAISRDNQNIAYVKAENDKYSIVLQHLSSKSETIVVKPQEYELRSINFSADGNHIFYVVRDPKLPESTVYQIPIYGGTKRKILTNVRHLFSISSDGNKLAYFRYHPKKSETSLMISKIDGSNEKIIATRKSPKFFQIWGTLPAWSPDDKKIVVSALTRLLEDEKDKKRSYFLEIDIETGKEKVIKSPDWDIAFQAYWLRDGSGLIVSVQKELNQPIQLWHLETPSGKASRITNDTNNYFRFRTSFDSKSLIVMNRSAPANLHLVDLENPSQIQQVTNETSVSNGDYYGLVWTKDGEHLIYIKSEGSSDGNLWKINIETKETQQLTFDKDKSIRKITMMPDGKSLLFGSNRSGKWQVWQIDIDGKNLKLFTKEVGIGYPEVTSDGKWLIYSTPAEGPFELRKMLFSGGESERVLYNAGGKSKSSPVDADQIITSYYDPNEKENDPWRYVLLSHAKKRILQDLSFVRIRPTFEWSKDGKGIFYPKDAIKENNVWYLSLKDKKTKQITNLKGKKIINLSVSPNGKMLAISGEEITSNILKISGFDGAE